MNDRSNFKLTNPELEADIYYLTTDEGGRESCCCIKFAMGQFHYDNHDWDAMQQFLDKEWCELGEYSKSSIANGKSRLPLRKIFCGQRV